MRFIIFFLLCFFLQAKAQSLIGLRIGTSYFPSQLINSNGYNWSRSSVYCTYGINAGLPIGRWVDNLPITIDAGFYYSQKRLKKNAQTLDLVKNQNVQYHLICKYYFADGKNTDKQFYSPYIGLGVERFSVLNSVKDFVGKEQYHQIGPQLSIGAQFLILDISLKGAYLLKNNAIPNNYYLTLSLGLGI